MRAWRRLLQEQARRPAGAAAPDSLLTVMRRAHMAVALGAVLVMGLIMAVPTVATLRIYADHDLRLLARALNHTVDAAVVFEDAEAAQEALNAIVADEDVAEATVLGRDGTVLAHWAEGSSGVMARARAAVSRLVREEPVALPVMHDGAVAGRISVRGGGRTLLRFLSFGLLGILACQLLIAGGALYLSGRTVTRIMQPLRALAEVARSVQRERAFGRRVPEAGIRELNDLGDSFNGLLAELDTWQSLMEGENRRLSHQASHDGLTGLANRAFFEGRLNRALTDAAGGGRVAVMLIDCDKFKSINDGFGHAAGDAVLVGIAARLQGQMREGDLVARLGGDEFAVLLVPGPDGAGLVALAEAIRSSMRLPIAVGAELLVTASLSVGFASCPEDGTSAAVLLGRADETMYAAKRSLEAARDQRVGAST